MANNYSRTITRSSASGAIVIASPAGILISNSLRTHVDLSISFCGGTVFANMRGAREPVFECDFPPGSDIVGEIMIGPRDGE